MDPNDPGQTPGEAPPPPAWGQPPAPEQPGYGAPPAPYGAPPPAPYGAPPPGYGAPPAPYGVPPGWGAPAPIARPSRLPRLIGAVAVVIVLIVAGLFVYGLATSQAGKVVFSTDVPTAGSFTGCTINNQVTSVSASTAVYATYEFKSPPGSEVVSLTVTKNGKSFVDAVPIPSTDTKGISCFSNTGDLSQLPNWGPGTYHFTATSNGSVIAAGDLTVK